MKKNYYVVTTEIGKEKQTALWWETQFDSNFVSEVFESFDEAFQFLRKQVKKVAIENDLIDESNQLSILNDFYHADANAARFITKTVTSPSFKIDNFESVSCSITDDADWYWAFVVNEDIVHIDNYGETIEFNIHNAANKNSVYYFSYSQMDDDGRIQNQINIRLTNNLKIKEKTERVKQTTNNFIFGHYDQESKGGDYSPIEWRILDEKNDYLLLVSDKCLDISNFSNDGGNVWERSDIRNWLNDYFYNTAFTEDEKQLIISSLKTNDKVFLLSEEEISKYFKNLDDRKAEYSAYARERYCRKISHKVREPYAFWWTRTATKKSSEYVVHICNSGIANCCARPGGHPDCVRPAIRIKKKS